MKKPGKAKKPQPVPEKKAKKILKYTSGPMPGSNKKKPTKGKGVL